MAKLGDIATYVNGYAFKPSDWSNDGLPIIRIQDLTGNSYEAHRFNGIYDEKYEINEGDILISWSASLGVYVWTGEKALLNQHIFKVVFDKVPINKSFFTHQVERILEKASTETHGSTMKHLTKPVFDALPFYYPCMEKQTQIALILDKVNALIALHKQQLAKLNELVKAQFVAKFASMPSSEFSSMSDVCVIITDGTHQPPNFVQRGIPFLFVSNITSNELTYNAEKFISEETYEELIKRTPIAIGDILLSTVGSYGHPAIVKSNQKFCFQRHIAYLKPNPDVINSEFLHAAILSVGVQRQIEEKVRGIAQKTLNLSEIKTLRFPLPSLDLQERFAAFVRQSDKSRLTIRQGLDKMETLKRALMQEYFGGNESYDEG